LFMTAGPLSGVLGGVVSGAILSLRHPGALAAWQWLFLLEGLPAIALGGVVFFYLADRPEDAFWLSDVERSWLQEVLLREQSAFAVSGDPAPWWSVFFDPRVLLLGLSYFCLNSSSYGISLWLPSVINELSARSSFGVGVLSAIPYLAAAVGMVVVGHHSDHTGERRWHAAGSAGCASVALLLAANSSSTFLVVLAFSFAVLGVFAYVGPFWAMPGTLLTGVTASAGIAFINSVGNLGGFAGPYILGVARSSSGNFKSGLLVLAFGMLLCAVLVLQVQMPKASAR
jgi:ACS family tartrate transporter-like MFS transporter